MKIYISGPITGHEKTAYQHFEDAERAVIAYGHQAVNPMKLNHSHHNGAWEEYMKVDLAELLKCDAMLLLHGWSRSKGSILELRVATALGIRLIADIDDLPTVKL